MTAKPLIDPGIGTSTSRLSQRVVNKDGRFNVVRKGARSDLRDVYLYMVNVSWQRFTLFALCFFLLVNLIFTGLYYLAGIEGISNIPVDKGTGTEFLSTFFFSIQTITTVGYGYQAPTGLSTNLIASIESSFGIIIFALLSGLLYGRFSRPTAKIAYSEQMLIAPLKGINTLQARVANKRRNNIIDIEARMLLILTKKDPEGDYKRQFYNLKLEISSTQFFPLSWTLVHPIDDNSPLHGKNAADLEAEHAEVIVSLKGHDETYNEQVHSRKSYRFDEIVWNARFKKTFFVNEDGSTVLDLELIGEFEQARQISDTTGSTASVNS